MIPLKDRMENLKRVASPQQYIRRDTEILIEKLKEINLPELNEIELNNYKKNIKGREYKDFEKKDLKEQFIILTEVFNIITGKYIDNKLIIINHYINHFKEILLIIEREKESKYKYYSLNVIIPLLKPELIRFVSKYDDIIKKDEEDTGYQPLNIIEKIGEKSG